MPDYAPVDLAADTLISFELNGRTVSVPPTTMLVDACFAHGVEVPIFCYEPRLGPAIGACRMCLVEVEGMRGLQTACSTPVTADMVVKTTSPQAVDAQDGVLELLLANHPLDCPVCDKGGECPLQDRTFRFGPGQTRFVEPKRHFPKPLNLSNRVALDRERCITCFRCVRFSQDVAQDAQLTMQERGALSEITTLTGEPYEGRFTGNIIDLCPVGALTSIPYRFVSRPWDVANTPSVCGLCSVGCNTELTAREGDVKRVTGRAEPNFAVEEGWLCDKGRWGYDAGRSADRLTQGVIRDDGGDRDALLEEAVEAASLLLRSVTGRVGVLVGASATVEEAAIAQDLAAGALGGARVARLGIPGHGLGVLRGLPGAQLGDLDHADLIVIVGGDPANQQPIAELRVRKARRFGATIASVGPRSHELEALGDSLRTTPGQLAAGVTAIAERIADSGHPIVLWDEADLAAEPDAAAELARIIGANPAGRQLELGAEVNGAGLRALGLPAEGLLEALSAGEIAGLILLHADPLSAPGRGQWSAALEGFEGPVIAIATHTDRSTDLADVVLPALTHWEQEGTLVSMTGRAQRLRPGATGPENAAPGWELLIALAHRLGAPPEYRTPAHAFACLAAAHPAFAGLTYGTIGNEGEVITPPTPTSPNGVNAARPLAGDGVPLVTTTMIYGDRATARSAALAGVRTPAEVMVGPALATESGLTDGAAARLVSLFGESRLTVRVDDAAPEGIAFATLGAPGAPTEALLGPDRGPVRVRMGAV